jgi:ornithine carbamoyltransferase
MKNLISLKDLSKPQIQQLVKRALEIKQDRRPLDLLRNKTLAMIFTKQSTRTRISAETGWAHYGGHPIFLGAKDLQLGSGEPLWVTSKVISSMADCILARVGDHSEIEQLAQHSSVPVINALTAKFHPLQILADLMTLYESFVSNPLETNNLPELPPLTISWVGDSNNILNSMLVTYPRLGLNVRVATPPGYPIDNDVLRYAKKHGPIFISNSPEEAVKGSDIIVTDTWISMGQESEMQTRLHDFKGFQVTEELARRGEANPNWKFLHCLPRKEYEVDDEVCIINQVFQGTRSLVFTEAENRKYTVMAVYEALMLNK